MIDLFAGIGSFLYIASNIFCLRAQRLVAQALGHFRLVAVILAGNLKPHSNVFSLSLGQVACSHVLGLELFSYFEGVIQLLLSGLPVNKWR
jgi:hypothetical protein